MLESVNEMALNERGMVLGGKIYSAKLIKL